MIGIGATTATIQELKASGTVTAINVNDQAGSYEVKISNVVAPKGIRKIFVPTWTEAAGQDDIVWHEAQLQTDGTYLVKITKSEHKNGIGKYISHVGTSKNTSRASRASSLSSIYSLFLVNFCL